MKILLTGSSGFIGSHLSAFLALKGHHIVKLRHHETIPREAFDAVINLSGAPIFRLWTKKAKKEIFSSRIETTREIASQVSTPLFICASAVGYYNGSGGKKMTEKDLWEGEGFLAKVVREWEEASLPMKVKGARVAHLRFGVVLSKKGGMLAKILPLFKLGLGAIMGSGKALMSWTSLEDLLRAVDHILHHNISGPVNICHPEPVSSEHFAKELALSLHRPLWLKIPSWLLGEVGKETILSSVWAYPEKLLDSGFKFGTSLSTSLRRS